MRHIIIKQFGPIKEIDIDLDKDLEVIIGPQASGKSTISKIIYFCRKIRDYFLQYLDGIINMNFITPTNYISVFSNISGGHLSAILVQPDIWRCLLSDLTMKRSLNVMSQSIWGMTDMLNSCLALL